ncbi:hypothetical protein P3T37_004039 [Kitasatospora sp. MAA4]|nr:hypothetical protein [Kitasatospora sp. MAA4]
MFGRPTSAPPTNAAGCSSSLGLPTPTTSDANGAGRHGTGGADLRTVISLLPTPRASHLEEGPEAVTRWLARRARPRRDGKAADTSLPLGLAVRILPELEQYAIGGSTARPSPPGNAPSDDRPPTPPTLWDA